VSKEGKSRLLKYGISAAVCIAIVVAYSLAEEIASQEMVNVYRILSDAFFLPAALFLFSGLLVWLSNEGALDAIGYMISGVIRFLIPAGQLKHEKYADYVERRREKNVTGYSFLFVVGAVCLVAALVFTWLYFQLHGPI
jgi:hypothetical protein